MAIALSGHGVGNLITAPLLTYIILIADWRTAFLSAGAIILLVVTLAALAMKDNPGSMGLRPYGETQEEERRVRSEDKKLSSLVQRFSVREILGRREFWLIYILWIVSTIVHTIYTQHLVLFAIGVGITAVIASLALGTIGLSSIIGRLTMGLLLDRIGITRTLVICYTINVGSALLLMITKSELSLFLFAFTFGFSFGGRTTLEVPLASSFVGLANLGIMSGMFETAFGVGGFIGPYLGGRMYDMMGQYYEVFLICTLLSVLSLAITLILRPEKKDIT